MAEPYFPGVLGISRADDSESERPCVLSLSQVEGEERQWRSSDTLRRTQMQ